MVARTLFVLVQYLFPVHRLFHSFQFFLSSSSKIFVMNINYWVASHVPHQFFIIYYFSITASHLFKRSHFSKKGVDTILIEYQTWFNIQKIVFIFGHIHWLLLITWYDFKHLFLNSCGNEAFIWRFLSCLCWDLACFLPEWVEKRPGFM